MAIASKRYETEHQERLTLYKLGMTDAQIAAALQVPIPTIVSWRRREGLAPNRAPRKARVTTPAANHPWRDRWQRRQKPEPSAEVAAPAAPTVDPVTRAAATCDAMAAARPAGRGALTDFPVMLRVEIPTGRILVDRRPWWLRRDTSNA
ncbi:MAG: hypothetical protein ACM3X3_08975 [Betaproteobacteria bacterium]